MREYEFLHPVDFAMAVAICEDNYMCGYKGNLIIHHIKAYYSEQALEKSKLMRVIFSTCGFRHLIFVASYAICISSNVSYDRLEGGRFNSGDLMCTSWMYVP